MSVDYISVQCPQCCGEGQFYDGTECWQCNGTGKIPVHLKRDGFFSQLRSVGMFPVWLAVVLVIAGVIVYLILKS